MTEQNYYIEYLNQLKNSVRNSIGFKLSLLHLLEEKLSQDLEGTINVLPFSLHLKESLLVDCILTVSKLVEDRGRNNMSVHKFLRIAQQNIQKISWKENITVTYADIESQIDQLKKIDEKVNNLITIRDRFFAHADKKYFFDRSLVWTDYPNIYRDIDNIIDVVNNIIVEHERWLSNSMTIEFSQEAYIVANKLWDQWKSIRSNE